MVLLSPQIFTKVSQDSEKVRSEWICFVNLWVREATVNKSTCFSPESSYEKLGCPGSWASGYCCTR